MSTTAHPAQQTRAGSGVLLVIGSCISLQFGAALATQLFAPLGSWGVTTLRLVLGAVVLLVLTRPAVRAWDRRQWRAVALFGVTMALMNGFFYAAIARIPLGVAVALEFLGPLVLSAVTSRRVMDFAWVGLALGGMGLLGAQSVLGGAGLDPLGVVFALIAGLFWAGYVLASGHVGRLVPGTGGLAASMTAAGLLLLPVGAPSVVRAGQEPHLLGLALLTALLASVIPYSLEPAFAALFGWLLLSQPIEGLRLLVIALVVLASMGTTVSASLGARRTRRRVARQAEDEPAGLVPPEEVVVGGGHRRPAGGGRRTGSAERFTSGAGTVASPGVSSRRDHRMRWDGRGYPGPHASLRLRRRLRPVHPGGGLPAPTRRSGCCGRGADGAALLPGARGAGWRRPRALHPRGPVRAGPGAGGHPSGGWLCGGSPGGSGARDARGVGAAGPRGLGARGDRPGAAGLPAPGGSAGRPGDPGPPRRPGGPPGVRVGGPASSGAQSALPAGWLSWGHAALSADPDPRR
ncbi:hypothetical protein I6H58_06425 [Rothia kristinae]|uniref:Inner membrane transporter rhtA n=1 Tax=Rothia kristinae TaxID=37923 RepID=A0A7T4MVV7_9MICC|nr:hypothetical protein [Rothia kristinae]QQC60577.1 hypothetical protein I6H58_06425 [Rothia kristinae]